jgi:hypothetical protein
MSDRIERGIDRQIREAEARGDFDDLPGKGKPLPGLDRPGDPDWWIRQKAASGDLGTDALPPTLKIRKDVEHLQQTLDALDDETAVRDHLDRLNTRIRDSLRVPVGPPLPFGPLDVEAAVTAWRSRR